MHTAFLQYQIWLLNPVMTDCGYYAIFHCSFPYFILLRWRQKWVHSTGPACDFLQFRFINLHVRCIYCCGRHVSLNGPLWSGRSGFSLKGPRKYFKIDIACVFAQWIFLLIDYRQFLNETWMGKTLVNCFGFAKFTKVFLRHCLHYMVFKYSINILT